MGQVPLLALDHNPKEEKLTIPSFQLREKLAQKSEHYYTRTGQAAYGANIREARKQGLLPSVTTIGNAASNYTLEQWKIRNGISVCIDTLLGLIDEKVHPEVFRDMADEQTRSQYIEQVAQEAGNVAKKAAEFGTEIHSGAEAQLLGGDWDQDNPTLVKLATWVEENVEEVIWAEETLLDPLGGFAGRADALFRHSKHGIVLADFKTRKMAMSNGKYQARTYSSDIRQLAAYASCLKPQPRVLSVLINSVEPMAPVEKLWTEEAQAEGLKIFRALAEYWRADKKYDPTQAAGLEVA